MTVKDNQVSDSELKTVIADFLEMGYVENIVAMFRREPLYYDWTADILHDDRLAVRLGMSVLFEELVKLQPDKVSLAVPSLSRMARETKGLFRGEALSILAIIGSFEAMKIIKHYSDDTNPQVRELVEYLLETSA